MKLTQNDITKIHHNSTCQHKWYHKTYNVHYFAGDYMHKMRKCKLCKQFISADMMSHINGCHHFSQPIKDGFYKCNQCDLAVHPHPVIDCSGGRI